MNKWLVFGLIMALLAMPIYAKALVNSIIYCFDNSTLIENITVYKDNNVSSLMLPVYCDWGCDNTTNSCNPPEYMQNVYNIIIVVIIIIFFAVLIAWAKRRR